MNTVTREVEFSFNNMMYVQTDGVAMGSPVGQLLQISLSAIMKCRNWLVGKGSIAPSYNIGMLMTFLLCLSLGRHATISSHGSTLSIQRWSLPRSWNRQTLYRFWTVGWWIQPWFHNIRLPEADFHRAVYSVGVQQLHAVQNSLDQYPG